MKNIAYDVKSQDNSSRPSSGNDRRRRQETGESRSRKGENDYAPGAPLFLNLFRPKLCDLPIGTPLKAGEMCLEIATPPVFGEAKNERRFYVFPVYLPENLRAETAQNALLAFEILQATNPAVRPAVVSLTALARSPEARAFAQSYASGATATPARGPVQM